MFRWAFKWTLMLLIGLFAASPAAAADERSQDPVTAPSDPTLAAMQENQVAVASNPLATAPGPAAKQGEAAAAPDPVLELFYLFPKLTHRLALHAEVLPTRLQDIVNSKVLLGRKYIIMIPFEAFEPIGLTNRGGKLVALKFVQGDREVLLHARDRVVFNVVVSQATTGAQAHGTWFAGNPDVLYKPPIVLAHGGRGPRFQPGPAQASAVGTLVDARGGVIDTWNWTREVVLTDQR